MSGCWRPLEEDATKPDHRRAELNLVERTQNLANFMEMCSNPRWKEICDTMMSKQYFMEKVMSGRWRRLEEDATEPEHRRAELNLVERTQNLANFMEMCSNPRWKEICDTMMSKQYFMEKVMSGRWRRLEEDATEPDHRRLNLVERTQNLANFIEMCTNPEYAEMCTLMMSKSYFMEKV